MAGTMMQKVAFGLFCWLMTAYATILGLIGLAWTAIRYPTTAFKSKKRNGERRFIPSWSCRGVAIYNVMFDSLSDYVASHGVRDRGGFASILDKMRRGSRSEA